MTLANISSDDARSVKASRIIDHDWGLGDRADEIERHRQRGVAGFLAHDDFNKHHSLDRREEMDADKARAILESRRERSDRQRRGVGAKNGVVRDYVRLPR